MINPYAPPVTLEQESPASRMKVVPGVPLASKWIGAMVGSAVAGGMIVVWRIYDFSIGFYTVPLLILAIIVWYCLHRESDRFVSRVRPEFAGKLALWGGTARWTKGIRRASGYLFLTENCLYFCSRPLREQLPEMAIPVRDMAGVHATQGVLTLIDESGGKWEFLVHRSQEWRNLIEAARVSASPWKPELEAARTRDQPLIVIPGWRPAQLLWALLVLMGVGALLAWQSSSSRTITVWPLVMAISWGSRAVGSARNLKRLREEHFALPGGPALCGGMAGNDFLVATPGSLMLLHDKLNDPSALVVPRREVTAAEEYSSMLALRLRDGGLRTFAVARPGQWAATLREAWSLPE